MLRLIASILLLVLNLSALAATPPTPKIAAHAYILMDYQTSTVLAQQNADQAVEPASITKLMTAYVVYQALKDGSIQLNDEATISEKAWRMKGSRMFIEVNKQVKIDDLLSGLVVQSGNDAAVALAEYVAGSEEAFVVLMNRQAEKLGLTQSHFANASGLPAPDHKMSAKDIALLAQALIRDFPEQYQRYSQQSFTFNGITQRNRNRLLTRDDTVDGLKTGYTQSAGYCLVSSAKRNDMRLISVVLGSDKASQRYQASQALLNYGFRFYISRTLFEANQQLTSSPVWQGTKDNVAIGVIQPLQAVVPKNIQDIAPSYQINKPLTAPIAKGQPVGTVTYKDGDHVVFTAPIEALHSVPRANFVVRTWDHFIFWLKHILAKE